MEAVLAQCNVDGADLHGPVHDPIEEIAFECRIVVYLRNSARKMEGQRLPLKNMFFSLQPTCWLQTLRFLCYSAYIVSMWHYGF
jgi:hypothetical protein